MMDFKEVALEFTKIYFSAHPEKVPEDPEKAFQEINRVHGKYKSQLIDKAAKKSEDFFSDKL
jgi:hypothetical protein